MTATAKKYRVVTIRDDNGDYVLHGEYDTLEDCRNLRQVTGDLVYDQSGNIVTDTAWLWDWERQDPTCYAQVRIKHPKKLWRPIPPWCAGLLLGTALGKGCVLPLRSHPRYTL